MYIRYEPSYGEENSPSPSYKTSHSDYGNYERVTPKRVENKAHFTAQNTSGRRDQPRDSLKSGRSSPLGRFILGGRSAPNGKNPIFGFIPPSVYNPETKKVFGFLKAEDILIGALILMLLENENNDEPMLIYVLLFVLFADYIDLSKFGL